MRRKITWMAMAWLTVLAGCAVAQPRPTRFGVVALTATHEPCVVLESPAQVGERITIAKLHPAEFVPARIRKPIAECGLGLAPGHAYELAMPVGQGDWWGSTAVVGDVPADLTFRDCTGTESVQLSVWRGTRRVWRGYYDVNYDMEASCTAEEMAD